MKINTTISNKILLPSLCFVGGYALNSLSFQIINLFQKHLYTPGEFSIDKNRLISSLNKNNHSYEWYKGFIVYKFSVKAIRQELVYRFFLETILQKLFNPVKSSCFITAFFAIEGLNIFASRNQNIMFFFKRAVLGFACSIVKQKIGLLATVFLHLGYNFKGCHRFFTKNLDDPSSRIELAKNVMELNKEDILSPLKLFLIDLTKDTVEPLLRIIMFIFSNKIKEDILKMYKTLNIKEIFYINFKDIDLC
ncbi:MAG: CPBP family glutamic-type intramembrane protease [Parachlamydiaceae bacterium]|nr:CPBP family glutamic-type intramembrane protease [Parachlamydiaceae bacterium]